jgi:hypothetical protein
MCLIGETLACKLQSIKTEFTFKVRKCSHETGYMRSVWLFKGATVLQDTGMLFAGGEIGPACRI